MMKNVFAAFVTVGLMTSCRSGGVLDPNGVIMPKTPDSMFVTRLSPVWAENTGKARVYLLLNDTSGFKSGSLKYSALLMWDDGRALFTYAMKGFPSVEELTSCPGIAARWSRNGRRLSFEVFGFDTGGRRFYWQDAFLTRDSISFYRQYVRGDTTDGSMINHKFRLSPITIQREHNW